MGRSFEIAECGFSYNSKMRKVSIGSDGVKHFCCFSILKCYCDEIHSPEKQKSIIRHVNELSLGHLLGEGNFEIINLKILEGNVTLLIFTTLMLPKQKRVNF